MYTRKTPTQFSQNHMGKSFYQNRKKQEEEEKFENTTSLKLNKLKLIPTLIEDTVLTFKQNSCIGIYRCDICMLYIQQMMLFRYVY